MKIDNLIEELNKIKEKHGNLEVTCTGSLLEDGTCGLDPIYETTVENLIVSTNKVFGTRVRVYF